MIPRILKALRSDSRHARRPFPIMPLHLYKLLNEVFGACGGSQLPRFDRDRFFLTDEIFDLSRARRTRLRSEGRCKGSHPLNDGVVL